MITKEEIYELLHSTETFRVERTTSTGDMDKFQEGYLCLLQRLAQFTEEGVFDIGCLRQWHAIRLEGHGRLVEEDCSHSLQRKHTAHPRNECG